MSEFVPPLGSLGVYKFKKPISDLVNTKTPYVCKSIRKISELLSTNFDVFNNYYNKYGISDIQYQKDKNDDISIVGLYSDSNVWLYIPSSQIDSYPDITGISYRRMAFAVDLGPVEESYDLNTLNSLISDLIFTQLGINPVVKVISLSDKTMVSFDDHESILKMRQGKIDINNNIFVSLEKTKNDLKEALIKINALEKFIIQTNSQ